MKGRESLMFMTFFSETQSFTLFCVAILSFLEGARVPAVSCMLSQFYLHVKQTAA